MAAASSSANDSHRRDPVFLSLPPAKSPNPTPHCHSISIPSHHSTITPTHPFLPEFKQFTTTLRSILTLAAIFLAILAINKRLDKTLAYVVFGLGFQSLLVMMFIYPFFERMSLPTYRNPSSYMLIRLAKVYASFTATEACCIAFFAMYHQVDTLTWSIYSGVFILVVLGIYEWHDTVVTPRIVTFLRKHGK